MSKAHRRLSALIAAAAIAGGVAAGVPVSSAFADTTDTAAHTAAACAKAHGKYAGKVVKTIDLEGQQKGDDGINAGTLKVLRSVKCHTVWARIVKSKAFSRHNHKTFAQIQSYDARHHRWNKPQLVMAITHGGLESPAIAAKKGTQVRVSGGFTVGSGGSFDEYSARYTYVLKH